MPVRDLHHYVDSLPRLQAEQALDRIAQTAAGTGSMEEGPHKQFMNELRRTVNRGRGAVEKVTAASLAAMRIAVETIEPPKEGGTDD